MQRAIHYSMPKTKISKILFYAHMHIISTDTARAAFLLLLLL